MIEPNGVLVLEDGAEFPGICAGAPLASGKDLGYGEVVFNTSMTGYQEILTDPSYYGQIVCMTYPHIGNTGINSDDHESSKIWCAGMVMRALTESESNWRSEIGLNAYLAKLGIPALTQVDTRGLTLHLRKLGVARGLFLPMSERATARARLATLPSFEGRDLIREVSTKKVYPWGSGADGRHIVAMDFGIKWNLLRHLDRPKTRVTVVPATTTAEEILALKPDGVFLSNGPGDPAAATYAIATIRSLLGKLPIFGVCMGHQLLALALGGKTYKLKFGHRGGNQPVLDHGTGKIEISSHNHGYAVDGDTLPKHVEVTHINLNDKTVEGLAASQFKAFSVQYHPEACPGPHDSHHLFDRFFRAMESL